MAKKTNFPKMEETAAAFTNRSADIGGQATTPRKSYSMVESALAGSRRQIQERLGHVGAIQVGYSYPTAPEAGLTGRNVYTMPPSAGTMRDFWAKRMFGQVQQ